MRRIAHYTSVDPPTAGQQRAIREFVESLMEAATVEVPFSYYGAADNCAVDWIDDRVGGVAFHRTRRARDLSVVHIVGTFVAPDSVRRQFVPMRLQVGFIEQCLSLPNLHWCFRTRNPLTYRAVRRYRDVLPPTESPIVAQKIVAACYGPQARFEPATGILYDSYPVGSSFLKAASTVAYRELAYERDECKVFCGPIDVVVASRTIERLRVDCEPVASRQAIL